MKDLLAAALLVFVPVVVSALELPDTTYSVFQFPADRIPRVDGDVSDWSMVPESYVIATDRLYDTTNKKKAPKPESLNARVKVGWVKGLNRLYFLYEAWDNYWDFSLPGLQNDIFEIVVDGDASGGPLVDKGHKSSWSAEEVGVPAFTEDRRISVDDHHWATHGVHAQNYHIFTPAVGKDWCMAWGAPTWIKEMPWANAAYSFDFKPGESGKLVLEFWITPFDYAGPEGPERAVQSVLTENKIIGLSWAVLDQDNVNSPAKDGFWNLSPKHKMFGQASSLCAFRLEPIVPELLPDLEARWSWTVADMGMRLVAFKDESVGEVSSWSWDFGDGTTSTEQHPIHRYEKTGNYVVILDVKGPAGTSRRSKVWDIQFKR